MTLVLDLPPELEARLRAQAERRGVSMESLALGAIDSNLAPDDVETRIARLRSAMSRLPRHKQPLPDSALGRGAFYEE